MRSPSVTDVNDEAPTFVRHRVSFTEGGSGTVYTAAATKKDAAGEAIVYSLKESGDHALFSIDAASGVVSYKVPPRYQDGGDNEHEITIIATSAATAADGPAVTAERTVIITLEDDPADNVTAPVIAAGETVGG